MCNLQIIIIIRSRDKIHKNNLIGYKIRSSVERDEEQIEAKSIQAKTPPTVKFGLGS